MATVTPLIISPVVRQNYFSESVTVVGANVVSVTCTAVGGKDSGISISSGLSQVTISGRYLDTSFDDVSIYVEKGSSNLLESPKSVVGVGNVPAGKELYEFNQDLKDDILKEYSIVITEELVLGTLTTTTATVSQYLKNDWTFGKDFMDGYFGNAT